MIRQLKDFIELVGDKQNRFAFLLQALNDLIELQNFVLRQCGGRFIENHYLGLKGKRTGNGHHMALGDAQGFQRGARIDLHLKAGEDRLRPTVHFWPVELFEKAFIQVLADKNILSHRQLIEQHRFLMNRGDADFMRRFRRRELNRNSLVEDFPLIRLIDAGHDFDQRGLPRAVFAHQRGHFAWPEIELHVLKGAHAGEYLGDPMKLQ